MALVVMKMWKFFSKLLEGALKQTTGGPPVGFLIPARSVIFFVANKNTSVEALNFERCRLTGCSFR